MLDFRYVKALIEVDLKNKSNIINLTIKWRIRDNAEIKTELIFTEKITHFVWTKTWDINSLKLFRNGVY